MEIKDVKLIEIFHTLEKIEAMNKAILFHQAVEEERDDLAIEQYAHVKAELTEQLLQLFDEMDLHLKVAAA